MKNLEFGRFGTNQFERDLEDFLKIERLSSFAICLLSVLLLVFCLVVPANAAEVIEDDDVTSETGISVYMDDGVSGVTDPTGGESDPGESSTGTGSGDNGGSQSVVTEPSEPVTEPSEPIPEPSEPPVVDVSQGSINAIVDGVTEAQTTPEPSGPVTVDVSEQSINAIADAVAQSDSSMTVTNKLGVSYSVPVEVTEYWNSYKNIVYVRGAASDKWFLSNDQITIDPSTGGTWNGSGVKFTVDSLGNVDKSTTAFSRGFTSTNIGWSNFDVQSSVDNTLFYESDVPVSYTISFDTGFDDLIVQSVPSFSFVAPVVEYPDHKFEGWYLDEGFTKPYSTDFIFYEDCTLYAKWTPYRTISFITNIEGFDLASIKVLSGEAYYVPSFTYEAHEFIGAFTDENFENAFVDGTVIDEDITLYLYFSEIQYDIGGLVSQLLGVAKGLDVIESQLWIILVVGMMYFVYKFFRIFF